jgi:hypothetical protein
LKSWNTTPIRRRSSGTERGESRDALRPSTTIWPLARSLRGEHQAQERRLARTRGTGQEHELAALELERDVAQRVRARDVRLRDVEQLRGASPAAARLGSARGAVLRQRTRAVTRSGGTCGPRYRSALGRALARLLGEVVEDHLVERLLRSEALAEARARAPRPSARSRRRSGAARPTAAPVPARAGPLSGRRRERGSGWVSGFDSTRRE